MNIHEVKERAVAAYIGLALGDALGATTEFLTSREIRETYGVHEKIVGGGWLGLKAGCVTDDTEMSLALGNAILLTGGVDAWSIADAFSEWLSSKPVDVGNTVRRGIIHYRYSNNPQVPPNEGDAGNGACMRALPTALVTYQHDAQDIVLAQRTQAHVTHNNELSDAAIDCFTAMLHAIFDGASKEELLHGPATSLHKQFRQFQFRNAYQDYPTGYIVDTMRAVLQAFFDTDSFKSCLVDVVNRGGDADTTGAIAGCIAGAYYGLKEMPGSWLNVLDSEVLLKCEEQALALVDLGLTNRHMNAQQLRQVAF